MFSRRILFDDNNAIGNIKCFHFSLSCLSSFALKVAKTVNPLRLIKLFVTSHKSLWIPTVFGHYKRGQNTCIYCLRQESPAELFTFINVFSEKVTTIKTLAVNYLSDILLFYIGLHALDHHTRLLFKKSPLLITMPILDNLSRLYYSN